MPATTRCGPWLPAACQVPGGGGSLRGLSPGWPPSCLAPRASPTVTAPAPPSHSCSDPLLLQRGPGGHPGGTQAHVWGPVCGYRPLSWAGPESFCLRDAGGAAPLLSNLPGCALLSQQPSPRCGQGPPGGPGTPVPNCAPAPLPRSAAPQSCSGEPPPLLFPLGPSPPWPTSQPWRGTQHGALLLSWPVSH